MDRSCDARRITNGDKAALHARLRAAVEATLAKPRDAARGGDAPCAAPALPAAEPQHRLGGRKFGVHLSHLTDAGLADLWVNGHVHDSLDLLRPGGTHSICNPAGPGFSNPKFADDLVVEV